LNPQILLLVPGQQLQAAAFMVLFKSMTFVVAGSIAVGKCQTGKNDTGYKNATDDDGFLFHDTLLQVCYYVFGSGAI
jgi:hypothetical protein